MSGASPVRINLRPLGSPISLGMSGLAVASLVQSGVELHWTPAAETAQAGLILIAVPFVLQIVACVFSYLARDGVTGAAVGLLSVTWLAIGLIHILSTPGTTSGPLGLLLLVAGGVLGLSASTIAAGKIVPAVVFGTTAVRFVLAGVYQLGGAPIWEHVAGIVGLVVTAAAGCALLVYELQDERGRALPSILGAGGTPAEPTLDLEQLIQEPGVRDSL